MLKLHWGRSLSWSHGVSSSSEYYSQLNISCGSPEVILLCIFVCFSQKQKTKEKKLPGCPAVSALWPFVLTGVFGSDRMQYLNLKSRVHRDDTAEAERLQLNSIQLFCWRIGGFFKRYWPCRGAFSSLQSLNWPPLVSVYSQFVFQLCSGSETLMNPHQPQQRLRWDERSWSRLPADHKDELWSSSAGQKWGQSVKYRPCCWNQARCCVAPALQALFL